MGVSEGFKPNRPSSQSDPFKPCPSATSKPTESHPSCFALFANIGGNSLLQLVKLKEPKMERFLFHYSFWTLVAIINILYRQGDSNETMPCK